MKQRGRKSADLLALPAVEVPRPQLEPPRSLTKAERLLLTELAANAPHLKPSDAPLLVSYVQATIASRRSARDPSKANLWEKATRLQASLATKLRLTAQARIDPQTLGRQRPPQTGPLPWEKT
jgi:hypothetical protein